MSLANVNNTLCAADIVSNWLEYVRRKYNGQLTLNLVPVLGCLVSENAHYTLCFLGISSN